MTNSADAQGRIASTACRASAVRKGPELVLVGFYGVSAGIEGAVPCGRSESHEHSPAQIESRNPIADAFLGSRRGRAYGAPELFERKPLLIAQFCEVLVYVPGNGGHG